MSVNFLYFTTQRNMISHSFFIKYLGVLNVYVFHWYLKGLFMFSHNVHKQTYKGSYNNIYLVYKQTISQPIYNLWPYPFIRIVQLLSHR